MGKSALLSLDPIQTLLFCFPHVTGTEIAIKLKREKPKKKKKEKKKNCTNCESSVMEFCTRHELHGNIYHCAEILVCQFLCV